jgi:hypothetical protein
MLQVNRSHLVETGTVTLYFHTSWNSLRHISMLCVCGQNNSRVAAHICLVVSVIKWFPPKSNLIKLTITYRLMTYPAVQPVRAKKIVAQTVMSSFKLSAINKVTNCLGTVSNRIHKHKMLHGRSYWESECSAAYGCRCKKCSAFCTWSCSFDVQKLSDGIFYIS